MPAMPWLRCLNCPRLAELKDSKTGIWNLRVSLVPNYHPSLGGLTKHQSRGGFFLSRKKDLKQTARAVKKLVLRADNKLRKIALSHALLPASRPLFSFLLPSPVPWLSCSCFAFLWALFLIGCTKHGARTHVVQDPDCPQHHPSGKWSLAQSKQQNCTVHLEFTRRFPMCFLEVLKISLLSVFCICCFWYFPGKQFDYSENSKGQCEWWIK